MMMIKINRFIAGGSQYSRRQADELIKNGKVKVNGQPAVLGMRIDPQKDKVKVNGLLVNAGTEEVYLLLNKPRGYIVTRNDPKKRPTVYELLDIKEKVVNVGRLDFNTSGAIIFTNNGEMVHRLTHPSYEVDRIYRLKVYGNFSDQEIDSLQKGVFLDGKKLAPVSLRKVSTWSKGEIVNLKLHEGRYREIRRICEIFDHKVKDLHRLSYGGIKLGGLKSGEWRFLSGREITRLKNRVGLYDDSE